MDRLAGKTVLGFEIMEYGRCEIALSGGYAVTAETLCRYVGENGDFVTSSDQGERFGLSEPFDAARRIREATEGSVVTGAHVAEDTGDLTLALAQGRLEILCSSAGYEAWQIHGPDWYVVGRGGNPRRRPP